MRKIYDFIVAIYIWTVGGIMFLIATIYGVIFFNILKKKTVYPPFKIILKILFKLVFIRVKTNLPKSFDKSKTYIFMANHTSLLDVPLMGAYLPVFANALEAEHHFNFPIYRWLIKSYGQIPINRCNLRKSLQSFQIAIDRLNSGTSIMIFPEGHRTKTGKLQKIKTLPFRMAKKSDAIIIPIGITGLWEICNGDSFYLKPGTIKMNFGDPITQDTIEKLSEKQLAELLTEKITQLINSN